MSRHHTINLFHSFLSHYYSAMFNIYLTHSAHITTVKSPDTQQTDIPLPVGTYRFP